MRKNTVILTYIVVRQLLENPDTHWDSESVNQMRLALG
jgi:hypothetical protein